MVSKVLSFRRFVRQLLHYRAHNLYVLDCMTLPDLMSPKGEVINLIDAASLPLCKYLQEGLISLNPENQSYLEEVSRERMICIAITYGEKIVHYGFLYLRNRMACLLGLPSDALLAGNAFTVPDFRGRGCQGRSMLARAAYARDAGYRWVMAETSPDNQASERGLSKVGMSQLGRVNYLVVLRYWVLRLRRPPGFPVWNLCRC